MMIRFQALGYFAVLAIAPTVWAAFTNGNFEQPIVQANQWTAGQDQLNTWYGANYSIDAEGAHLDYVGGSSSLSAARSLIQVLAMPESGTYTWTFDNQLTEYDNQWSYWQVYLLADNASINLEGGPAYGNNKITNAKNISAGYAPSNQDGGKWYSYTDQFSIMDDDLVNYNYVAFILTGSLYSSGQVLGYGNFGTTIPEPVSLALLAGGGLFLMRRKR